MGTRYVITRQDVEKMGLAVEETAVEVPEYDDNQEYAGTKVLSGFLVVIGGWAFDSYSGESFHGPKVGKSDLDEIFRQAGVEPDWC